jgi:hypothetical protein
MFGKKDPINPISNDLWQVVALGAVTNVNY